MSLRSIPPNMPCFRGKMMQSPRRCGNQEALRSSCCAGRRAWANRSSCVVSPAECKLVHRSSSRERGFHCRSFWLKHPRRLQAREWYERVLLALDEPIIEEVIYREVGTSLNEARLAEMATDIVAGEQQVELDFRLPRAITQFASDGERGGSRSGKCRRSEPPSHPTDKHASRNSQTET